MIPLIKSTFYEEKKTKKQLVEYILHAKKLSFGKECERFEKKFAKWQGREHCIFVNSGSSANLAVIQALLNLGKIKKGDCIGFSALTWSTNVMPLIQLGLRPVPIDIALSSLNVSSQKFKETLVKYPIKMLLLTNLLGFCDDIDEIKKICDEKQILLIEDNCEALGSVYKGKKLGNFGYASTFSFYVGHHLSTIEGGAICTDDEDLAEMLRIVRAHGWDRNLTFTKQRKMRKDFKVNSSFYSRYTFYDLGFNMRPTEINGFIGSLQLRFINKIIARRDENFKAIALPIYARNKHVLSIQSEHMDVLSNFAIPIICKSKSQRDLYIKLCKNKIEIRPIVGGDITRQPFFMKYAKGLHDRCPNAELVHEQGFYFGNNPELNKIDRKYILSIFS